MHALGHLGEFARPQPREFFSTVQLLTVSSQMRNPVTTGSRIVDIVLERGS